MPLEALCGYGNVAGEKAGALWYRCGERRRLEPRGRRGPCRTRGQGAPSTGRFAGEKEGGGAASCGREGHGREGRPKVWLLQNIIEETNL